MYKFLLATLLILFVTQSGYTQYVSSVTTPDTSVPAITDTSDVSFKLAQSITADDLRTHLTILASDEYEGRETGERGNELAAAYIANHFSQLNLPKIGTENTYYQGVAFHKAQWTEDKIAINNNEYRHLWDFLSFPAYNDSQEKFFPEEIVFLGYGIDDPKYSDYKGNDVRGKVIMINKGEPVNKDSISYITGTKEMSDWSEDVYTKLKAAKDKGARLVLIIENELTTFLGQNRRFLVSPRLQLGDGQFDNPFANHIYISTTMAKEIIGSKDKKIKKWRKKNIKKAKTKDIALKPNILLDFQKQLYVLQVNNVMGYIEGTDKKDELIVISAHYDHLGKRGDDVYNGADDNGSGTSTVLELTEAFALAAEQGYKPRRSILLLLVTGEEKGLLGSEYYAENPVFDIANTVADINIDMVGRVDEKYTDNPEYIYVIGSDRLSSELHVINEEQNQKYSQLVMDYKYNSESDPNRYYFRSDHYNFAKKGIPAIFFFNGTHEDYHRTSDTVDKINFEKMAKIGQHVFHLTWELANRENRIIVDGEVKE